MQLSRNEIYTSFGQRVDWVAHCVKSFYRRKEYTRVAFLSRYIPPHGVIFDVGANVGSFAKEFCHLHGKTCRVYCFEPVSYAYSILSLVTWRYANATAENVALAERKGAVDISIPVKASGRLGMALSHFGEEMNRDFVTESITATTLDAYVQKHQIDRLDFIKCDVEGAEMLVFQGGAETISRFQPTIYCELDNDYTQRIGYGADEVFSHLIDIGYRAYRHADGDDFRPVKSYQGPADYLFRME